MPTIQDLSSESSGSEDEIPARKPANDAPVSVDDNEPSKPDAEVDDAEGDDDNEEEELYVVEEIIDHQFQDGVLLYKIKWEGYEKKSDQTWESEDKLEGATEALNEYHSKIGGKPVMRRPAPGAKRPRTDSKPNTPSTAGKAPKARRLDDSSRHESPTAAAANADKNWAPPKGSWEDDVMIVDTIEQDDDRGLHVYLDWNNGRKTRHPIEKAYKKCPVKMLRFYEQHLVFKEGDAPPGAVSGSGKLSKISSLKR